MASFFKNTFDNLVNNINSKFNQSSPRQSHPSNGPNHSRSGGGSHSRRCPNDNRPAASGGQTQPVPPRVPRRTHPRYWCNGGGANTAAGRAGEHSARASSQPATGRNQHHQNATRFQYQQPYSNMQNQSSNMSTNAAATNKTRSNDNIATTVDKIDIGDVRDPTDIKALTTRQLRIILTRNCVDHKGAKEKEFLQEKVLQLWVDHNKVPERRRAAAAPGNTAASQNEPSVDQATDRSQEIALADEIDENQVCKICMEREINCVLLECGHMLSCVTCARKLAECPVCRQNVSRCVRIFKG